MCPEKDEVYENISINRFFKILNNNKREMLSNK